MPRRTMIAALIALSLAARPEAAGAQLPRRATLDVYFIDVEGGQSTLMVAPNGESFLIDAGFPAEGAFTSVTGDPATARDARRILAAARDAGVARIDHLLVTHYHADHVGGVPELARLLPIREFIDHAAPTADGFSGVPGTVSGYEAYVRTRGSAPHRAPEPGDRLPFDDADVTVVSSLGETLHAPLPGAGSAGEACGNALPPEEKNENPRSLGVLVQFGAFRFLDVGDLSGAPLDALTCPTNMVGTLDAYLVAHHGGIDAAAPAMFRSARPRVAIVNNGARKGGATNTLATLGAERSIAVWQLHRSLAPGAQNADDARIANLDESTNAWLKLSARRDGSFSVTNGRTSKTVDYPARR